MRLIGLITLAVTFVATSALSQSAAEAKAVDAFVEEMAAKHDFDHAALAATFDDVRFRPRIIELMNKQTKRKQWKEYRALFVNRQKIEGGIRFWRENRPALDAASEKFGVPPEIIIAVIGVETHYGRNTGGFKVLDALTTLAFGYPKRAPLFRLELEHFLLLAREESMAMAAPKGSYAGAMGIGQFMPGSYRRYAIDFDGDGERDLFSNTTDAIGSVANYLTAYGWQRSEPVAAPAVLDLGAQKPFETAKLSTRYSLEDLQQRGVSATGAFPSTKRAIPLTLTNADGPEYWLGFDNFYVITRYNHSVYYAMAVYHLSRELREHAETQADGPL